MSEVMEKTDALDIRQLSDAVRTFELMQKENDDLKAELNQLKASQRQFAEKMELYNEFAKIIEEKPVEYLNVTLRDPAILQKFFLRLKKDQAVDINGDNTNAIKKAEHLIGFLFWWVVNDNTRWSQMMMLYRNAMR